MKLSVPTPPGWSRRQVAGGELLRAPGRDLELLVSPIEGAKLEPPKWLWTALVQGLRPPVEEPTQIINGQLKTAAGWMALTVEAQIGAAARFVAYFTFLDLAATVIATCTDGPASQWRDEVIAILYVTTPDFSGSITGLGELLGGPPPISRADPGPLPSDLPWRRAFSGGDVVLVPRLDPDSGWIRRAACQTPRATAAQLFSGFDARPELGVTGEGEYFAIATAARDGAQRTLAIVFGAESYTRIEAVTTDPARFDPFRTAARVLAYQEVLGYGAGRLRPFYYQAPAGWTALPRSGSTLWISPTCARRYHVLRVFEACPVERETAVRGRRFETIAAEFLATPPRGPATYYTNDGHEVRVYAYDGQLRGGDLRLLDVALLDGHYCYPLRLECDPHLLEESLPLLEEVVRTIVPLPAAAHDEPAKAQAPEMFSYWAD